MAPQVPAFCPGASKSLKSGLATRRYPSPICDRQSRPSHALCRHRRRSCAHVGRRQVQSLHTLSSGGPYSTAWSRNGMGRNSTHAHERRELRLHSRKLPARPISRLTEQERAGAFRLPNPWRGVVFSELSCRARSSLVSTGARSRPPPKGTGQVRKSEDEVIALDPLKDLNTTWAADANQAKN